MKKIICIFILFCILLTSVGCDALGGHELGQRLIIEAIGIDSDENGYLLTLQALDLKNTDPSGSKHPTKLLRFRGKTLGDAFGGIAGATGLTPLYSQARFILFGRSAAETGLGAPLDFFMREYNARSDVLIAVTDGPASDFFGSDDNETIAAEEIELAMESGSNTGQCAKIPLYCFVSLSLSESDTAYCPILKKDEKQNTVTCHRTAFFRDGKWTDTTDERLTEGFLLLQGELKNATVTVHTNDGAFTLRVINAEREIKLSGDANSQIIMNVKVVADVIEYESGGFYDLGEEEVNAVGSALKKELESILKDAFQTFYTDWNMDVCRLFRRFRLLHPNKYSSYNYTILEDFADGFICYVSVTVRRTGREQM
ncbi:MAG: VCBS domain-containing protein [Clostridia bacterium]|nr:VCBS domain-containing protein [Clostridia bacterium]